MECGTEEASQLREFYCKRTQRASLKGSLDILPHQCSSVRKMFLELLCYADIKGGFIKESTKRKCHLKTLKYLIHSCMSLCFPLPAPNSFSLKCRDTGRIALDLQLLQQSLLPSGSLYSIFWFTKSDTRRNFQSR